MDGFKHLYAWGKLWYISPLQEYSLSFLERRMLEFHLLKTHFSDLIYDRDFSEFEIPFFPLPEVVQQKSTRLYVPLSVYNDKDENSVYPHFLPQTFYLSSGLVVNERLLAEDMLGFSDINYQIFNNLYSSGLDRYLLPVHPSSWQPTWDISKNNLIDLVKLIAFNIQELTRGSNGEQRGFNQDTQTKRA